MSHTLMIKTFRSKFKLHNKYLKAFFQILKIIIRDLHYITITTWQESSRLKVTSQHEHTVYRIAIEYVSNIDVVETRRFRV